MPTGEDGRPAAPWGRKASKGELASWRSRLRTWQGAPHFRRTLEAMRRIHRDHGIDQPGSDFRDAFVASRCADILGADAVRLGEDPPDFELKFGDRIVQCEAVEVQRPGRRRGDELNAERKLTIEARQAPRHIPAREWTPAADALAQLAAKTRDKAEKMAAHRYAPGTVLVVYLNTGFVAGRAKLLEGMEAAMAQAIRGFGEVWVLDNGEVRRFVSDPTA